MVKLTDELLAPLYHAMGVIVIHWAYIEQPLDLWVAVIYHHCDGKTIAKTQQIPRSFSTKIKFLRTAFQKLEPLAAFKEEGLSLLVRAESLSNDRNDMIHMRLCRANPDGTFDFYKFDYTQTIHEVRKLTFSINDFLQFGKKMLDLAADLMKHCDLLAQHFLPSK